MNLLRILNLPTKKGHSTFENMDSFSCSFVFHTITMATDLPCFFMTDVVSVTNGRELY